MNFNIQTKKCDQNGFNLIISKINLFKQIKNRFESVLINFDYKWNNLWILKHKLFTLLPKGIVIKINAIKLISENI
jgi:hypothetical protein